METATIGQTVWFYADHDRTRGMLSNDMDKPFAAIIADIVSERVVNLLVIDHIGGMFPMENVALFLGDDEDDRAARCHCELEPPKPTDEPDETDQPSFSAPDEAEQPALLETA